MIYSLMSEIVVFYLNLDLIIMTRIRVPDMFPGNIVNTYRCTPTEQSTEGIQKLSQYTPEQKLRAPGG